MAFNPALSQSLKGNRLDLSIEDRSGKVQNFYAIETDIVDAMKEAMRRCRHDTREIAFELCPKDTWFMAEHIRETESDDALVFEVGWWASDFFEANLDFYPPYVVLGTRFQPPQDPLTPAYNQTKPLYRAAMAELTQEALQRRAVRAGRAS